VQALHTFLEDLMNRPRFSCLTVAIAVLASSLFGRQAVAQQPSDLQVQLRSATGSNRFQIGEMIPLEVVLSSNAADRYLEPCAIFRESNFGFPQCRYFTRWSFSVAPDSGWVDLYKEFPTGPQTSGGPTFPVPSRDLSSKPVTFTYLLTHRFRFDTSGEYRVQLSISVALDDVVTRSATPSAPAFFANDFTLKPEIVLQITPASAEWQAETIRKGYEAYSSPSPRVIDPPSPELLQYRQSTQAFCNLGTPDAARALAKLLSQNHPELRYELPGCLEHTVDAAPAIEEMRRLLVDPDVAVSTDFFSVLVTLLSRDDSKKNQLRTAVPEYVNTERDRLFAALSGKHGDAQVQSLLTVLANPSYSKGGTAPYDVPFQQPFPPLVIAAVVANFERLPEQSQQWVLDQAWNLVRSPRMLPVVHRSAEAGDGQALLRWLELDPAAATAFIRQEIVRSVPRFSSFYLRLPDESLPGQEKQIATNFIALTNERDLAHGATLLHRYATREVLPTVLPFIDAQFPNWSCAVKEPVLAYLMKVSPEDAEPRVEQTVKGVGHGRWCTNTIFTELGFLEPSPVLERFAMAEIEANGPLARDATDYLRLYGSAAAKPFVWKQFVRWHEQFVSSGAEKRLHQYPPVYEDYLLNALVNALAEAFTKAQAWVITPDEATSVQQVQGAPAVPSNCTTNCGASLGLGPGPGSFAIYGGMNERWLRKPSPMEFLNSSEGHYYLVGQYRCSDIRTLKQKLLQFPQGSSFEFVWGLDSRDRDYLVEISDFLWGHGYKVKNPQKWDFLRPDPPQ
jgi:hypothetical protein